MLVFRMTDGVSGRGGHALELLSSEEGVKEGDDGVEILAALDFLVEAAEAIEQRRMTNRRRFPAVGATCQ